MDIIPPKKKTMLKVPVKKEIDVELTIPKEMADRMKGEVAKGILKRKADMVNKQMLDKLKNK